MNPDITPEATSQSTTQEKSFTDIVSELQLKGTVNCTAEEHSLLALVYFKNEQYGLAAEGFQKAAQMDPSNEYFQQMLSLSLGNHISEVQVPVPDVYYFDRESLLRVRVLPQGALPSDPPPPARDGLLKKFRKISGNILGSACTGIMSLTTGVWGRFWGYKERVWTNWYRRPLMFGVLTLAYMREKMNKNNLRSTYPADTLVGFQEKGQDIPEGVRHFRTADGSWNNLKDPLEGAAGTRFGRNVSFESVRPETGKQLMTPNPREISRHLLTRKGDMKEVPFLNMLAAAWIQFENHDWINHGENRLNDLLEVPLVPGDPAIKKFWQTKMFVPKSQIDPTRMDGKEDSPVSFINEVTHWWDASQIYGSDQETVTRLRSGINGKLRLNNDGTLPLNNKGLEETGFMRNWWIGLSMLHTLFVKEHNAICDHLSKYYPQWDDNRLFNTARLINAAITAKIHSVEWTPAILPNKGLNMALNANWYGILTNLLRKPEKRKTLAEINVRNPELGGVVGNPINKHHSPYALTQEFVEVYRLHSLLPENLHLKKLKAEETTRMPFIETRQAATGKLLKKYSHADLFYSFGNQHPGQLVMNNFPRFMQELSIPFNPVYDLGAVDIIRARERGVPRYNEFRRQLGLNPIASFDDLTDDAEEVRLLKEVYGNGKEAVELLDLLIGTLAEGHRPSGFGFGETMFQIFILNASRRLQADRFYTDCYNEECYTKEGLEWIDRATMKSVILRHYPELAATGLANVNNAFEPWDEGTNLDPARHPLEAAKN